jgi:hypothetical protein
MARDNDKNGFSIPVPRSIYDASYIAKNGLAKRTVDSTNLGWRPKWPIPDPRNYFPMISGRKEAPAETEAERSLGNKWKKR